MDDDEFDFSDPDLDDLPANTLQQLETTALRATQGYVNISADDSAIYGFDDDDEVIDLNDTAGAPRFGRIQQNYRHNTTRNSNDELYGEDMETEVDEPPRQSQADVNKLLERIKRLEQDKRRLNNDLQTATAEANKKAGEADNLRRRAETANRTTEQHIAAQQRQHRELNEKLRAERDNLQRQLEQARTSNAFDEYNRQEEAIRRPRKAIPSRAKSTIVSPEVTPKKAQKTLQLGDGFDDDDVVMASPSKRREKSRAATPKQANKRKRQITNDSPIPALQLSEPRERPEAPERRPLVEGTLDVALLRNLWKSDQRFSLLQRLLTHRCSNGTERVLEVLALHAFPSQPQEKLSAIVYDSLSGSRQSSNVHQLAVRICHAFLKLWKQCLREKYYAPLHLILDTLHFILACEPARTAIEITEQIVPLAVDSIRLVAVPVYEASKGNPKKVAALFSMEQCTIGSEVDVQGCLEILYLVATSCVACPSPYALSCFWRSIHDDFVLLMLIKEQPLPYMALMLRILSTSALSTSIGPIGSDDSSKQAGIESSLVFRLTSLFSDTLAPIPDPKEPSQQAVPEAHIWQVRLKVLDVLTEFSIPEHGCSALAHHDACIGRLVKYLNYCVTSLYARPLSPTQSYKIASVNATMKLLYHIATSTGVQIKDKLKGTLGGDHAYQVALTRIAFSEGLVLEEGIETEVMDMAHDILDADMSPEEGEALMEVFPSGNSV